MDNSIENITSTSNSILPLAQSQVTPLKRCWICFVSNEDNNSIHWLSPCRCQGTEKWVHEECLQRWIDEKRQGSNEIEVSCPICNAEYMIVYPKPSIFVYIFDRIEHILNCSFPFIAGGILVGYVYWTAITFGAISIIQIYGHKEGLNVMEKTDSFFLLIGLPMIPIVLIFSRMIKWEESILKFLRKYSDNNSPLPRLPTSSNGNVSPLSLTRLICGGLILPTIATIFGNFLFQNIHSNIQRTVLGGITFIILKGITKIYYRQNQYIRGAYRKILNFDPQFSSKTTIEINQSNIRNTNQ